MSTRPARAEEPTDFSLVSFPLPEELSRYRRLDVMVAFQGGLYLGLTPEAGQGAGQGAALWRLDLGTRAWQPLPAPPAPPEAGHRRLIPSFSGVPGKRSPGLHPGVLDMVVFQGASDAAPCLYVATQSLKGAQLWRSPDGHSLQAVLSLPAEAGYLGFSALTVWNDRLVMTSAAHLSGTDPARAVAGTDSLPARAVLGSRDPGRADRWEVLSEPGFGDSDNQAITALHVYRGGLCAATFNPVAGFQIWTCTGTDGPDWVCTMAQGAGRHGMNAGVALLVNHLGHLWIGTAMDEPELAELDWPAAELLRIRPDGSWELIAGQPRLAPQGLLLPLSGLGPGLEDPGLTRLAAMVALSGARAEGMLLLGGGPLAGLWQSHDGETWSAILEDRFDEIDQLQEADALPCGITAMVAAEESLWIALNGGLYTLEQG